MDKKYIWAKSATLMADDIDHYYLTLKWHVLAENAKYLDPPTIELTEEIEVDRATFRAAELRAEYP